MNTIMLGELSIMDFSYLNQNLVMHFLIGGQDLKIELDGI